MRTLQFKFKSSTKKKIKMKKKKKEISPPFPIGDTHRRQVANIDNQKNN